MRVLRGTLTFVLGMVIGIILFVLAIGGAVYMIGTSVTVGELQSKFTDDEIISSDSAVYNKSVWDTVMQMVDDIKLLDTLSMKGLYDTYGISLLKGLGDIDFTSKEFYDMPVKEVLDDMSIVFDAFTLNDIGSITGIEFPDLPIIQDNLDTGIKTALENIMGSIDDNLTVRDISNKFGIDIGVEANKIIESLQDAPLSTFGDVLNAMRLDTLMNSDTDTFLNYGANKIYIKLGENGVYEQVNDLSDTDVKIGVETYISGAIDSDEDGTCDTLIQKELRYVKKVSVNEETGEEETTYVVDNSCYAEDFDIENNEKTFYRHVLYALNDGTRDVNAEDADFYMLSYANRIASFDGADYTLVEKGFFSLNDLFTSDHQSLGSQIAVGKTNIDFKTEYAELYLKDTDGNFSANVIEHYAVIENPIDKDSRLEECKASESEMIRVHIGTSSQVLQLVAHMTVAELQDADDILDSIKISDVVDTDAEDCSRILKAIADCKLNEVNDRVNELSIAQMMDINFDKYEKDENGKFVLAHELDEENNPVYVEYDDTNVNCAEFERFNLAGDEYVKAEDDGKYMYAYYFTPYNPAVHDALGYNRYSIVTTTASEEEAEEENEPSSKVLQRLAYMKIDGFAEAFSALTLGETMDIDIDLLSPANDDTLGTQYYYDSENSLYMRITDANKDEHATDTKYYISVGGDDSSVLKRLAYVKIDNMSAAMDKIMKDMLLSELVDIYDDYAVEEGAFDNSTYDESVNRFFIEGSENEYVYALADKGNYCKGNWQMVAYTEEELEAIKTAESHLFFVYEQISPDDFATLSLTYNVFYKGEKTIDDISETVYENNLPLCTYDKMKNNAEHIYKRVETGLTENAISYSKYNDNDIYVLINGAYVKYNPDNLAHANQDNYYHKEDGECFIPTSHASILNEDGSVDSPFKTDDPYYYAKHQSEKVYFKADNGKYVFVNGEYVQYDAQLHADKERYEVKYGYIAKINEVYLHNTDNDTYTTCKIDQSILTKVNLIREKSQAVLRMLEEKQVTIDGINGAIQTATISEIIEVQEGSLFAEFGNATLENLNDSVEGAIKDMSIGKLLEYTNITTIDPVVKNALKDVVLSDFFSSLKFDSLTGYIIVDMAKACGFNA